MPEVVTRLRVRGAEHKRGMEEAGRDVEKYKKNAEKNLVAVRGGFKAAGLAAGAAAVALGKSALTMADDLVDAAEAAGMSTDELARLQWAFMQGGVGASKLDAALARLNQTIDGAREGEAAAVKVFERLGISFADVHNKSPREMLMLVADALARVEDPSRRAGLAMDLFGDSGVKMIPVLGQGGKALDELARSADVATTAGTQLGASWNQMMENFGFRLKHWALTAGDYWAKVFGFDAQKEAEAAAAALKRREEVLGPFSTEEDWKKAMEEGLTGEAKELEKEMKQLEEKRRKVRENEQKREEDRTKKIFDEELAKISGTADERRERRREERRRERLERKAQRMAEKRMMEEERKASGVDERENRFNRAFHPEKEAQRLKDLRESRDIAKPITEEILKTNKLLEEVKQKLEAPPAFG